MHTTRVYTCCMHLRMLDILFIMGCFFHLFFRRMSRLLSSLVKDPRWSKIQLTVTDDLSSKVQNSDIEMFQYPSLSSDSICFLQFTSGSTSNPKGVVVTHGSLLHNCHACHSVFSFPSTADGPGGIPCKPLEEFPFFEAFHFWEDRHNSSRVALGHRSRIFSWLPVYHDMGLIGFVCCPLLFGVSLIQMSPIDFIRKPHLWVKAISDYHCICCGAPNFAYELLCRKTTDEVFENLNLSGVVGWLCGAEPVRASTLEKFLKVRKYKESRTLSEIIIRI